MKKAAETGTLAIIKGGKGEGKTVYFVPISMRQNFLTALKPYASKRPGLNHACGHDAYDNGVRNGKKPERIERHFAGTVLIAFQPEEIGAGAEAESLLEKLTTSMNHLRFTSIQ